MFLKTVILFLVLMFIVPVFGQRTGGAYWLANNPNAAITDAEVTALGLLTQTEIEILDGATVTTAELNLLGGMNNAAMDSLADLSAAEIDMLDGINGAASGFWEGAPIQGNFMESAFWYTEDFIGVSLDSAGIVKGGAQAAAIITNFDATLRGWKHYGTSGWTMTQPAGTLGGQLILTTLTGSDNEFSMTLGALGTETFVEFTKSSKAEVWLEISMAEADTSAAGNFFVGFSEEGAAVTDVIVDAGNEVADLDFVGFICFEARPDTVEAFFQTSGDTKVDTFGYQIGEGQHQYQIHFDGDSTINWLIDGTSLGTVYTTQPNFPDTEELTILIAAKQGTGDKVLTFDWIKLVSEISR